jgi:pimeloyl-ACP methyl ester carboxylesterase
MNAQATLYLVNGLRLAWPFMGDQAENDRARLMEQLRAEFPSVLIFPASYKDLVDLNLVATPKLMLVGHSFGGDRCLTWIENAPHRKVDSLFLLDPVPDDSHVSRRYSADYQFEIPGNVVNATCYRRSQRLRWPFSKSINANRAGLVEYLVEEGHGTFYRNAAVIEGIRASLATLMQWPVDV